MLIRRGGVERGPTWGCGYAAPTPRMQYTASSFAQMLVGLFAWALRPKVHRPERMAIVSATGPLSTATCPTPCWTRWCVPAFRRGGRLFSWFRVFQQGSIQTYLLYIFLALIALLLWR